MQLVDVTLFSQGRVRKYLQILDKRENILTPINDANKEKNEASVRDC